MSKTKARGFEALLIRTTVVFGVLFFCISLSTRLFLLLNKLAVDLGIQRSFFFFLERRNDYAPL